MWRELSPAFRLTLIFTVVTGLLYPGLVTALCQTLFRTQANGSLVSVNGRVVGSALLSQNFTRPEYFHPRPSAAGANGYDAAGSGASNLGPTSEKLVDRVKSDIAKFHAENPDSHGPIPADAVTTSASGLDPDISVANAEAQAPRIAHVRHLDISALERLISQRTEGRLLGFLGEPRVNVLALNIALDRYFTAKP